MLNSDQLQNAVQKVQNSINSAGMTREKISFWSLYYFEKINESGCAAAIRTLMREE